MNDNGNGAMALYNSRIRRVTRDLVELVRYYQRFTELDQDGFRLGVYVMLGIELDFADNPTPEAARQLQDLWKTWSDHFIHDLEDLDLSLNYAPDRQRFQDFLEKLEAAREPLLSTHPAAARP